MAQGMVLFTDGGFRNYCGGWGFHGYLYDYDTPKKSSGNPNHILTSMGYVIKNKVLGNDKVKTPEVTPIHYVDGYGGILPPTTNNVAELLSTINGLKHAFEYDIKEIQVFTDSEYVRKGLEIYVDNWRKNGWLKGDQKEPANVELWKSLVFERDRLRDRGVTVKVNWVKGHSDKIDNIDDILGNVLADRLATIGVMAAVANKAVGQILTSEAEGYWKYTVERHPFIMHRRMYFNTLPEYIREGEYYLGDHGKDDDLLGKRISDGAYSVVILEKPDTVLELVRKYQSEISDGTDSIIMARLDHIYRSDTHQELTTFGNFAMEQANQYRLDLSCLDREPLTRELRPPKLAMRAVESVSDLADKLFKYLKKDVSITTTDITDIIYETTHKVVKKETINVSKLKPEFNVGFAALPVLANYETNRPIKAVNITLTLGIDLLDRNALKRLELLNPKVTVISWLDAPEVFRYATIVEVNNDKCISAGVYSNLRVVPHG